jgi:hypothetical protein
MPNMVLGDVPGRRLGTGPDDAESLAHAHTPHLRREPPHVIPHAGLDVLRRGRGAPERLEFSVGGLDATADASKIMPVRGMALPYANTLRPRSRMLSKVSGLLRVQPLGEIN